MTFSHLVLLGFFVSTSFHFYFPLMTLLLIDSGMTPLSAATAFGSALLITGLVMPSIGRKVDDGKETWVALLALVALLTGLAGFWLRHSIPAWALGITALLFVNGTAVTYFMARRITEGFAKRDNLPRASTLTYLVENAGLGTAAVISAVYVESYYRQLVIFDAISSIVFCLFILFVSKQLKGKNPTSNKNDPAKFSSIFNLIFAKPKFVCGTILIVVACFAYMSAFQIVLSDLFTHSKKVAAEMKIVNTLTVLVVATFLTKRTLAALSGRRGLVISAFFLFLGYATIAFDQRREFIMFASFCWAIAEAVCFPLVSARLISMFKVSAPGEAVAARDLVVRLGLFASPLIGGLLSGAQIGTFSGIYAIVGIAGVALCWSEFSKPNLS